MASGECIVNGVIVNDWLINYIKNHGGPYEIPQECKNSWDKMKSFLDKEVFDKKIREKKRKGMIVQGLLSCGVKLMEIVAQRDEELKQQAEKYETAQKDWKDKMAELRLHAVTTGEALIEKAKLCEQLSNVNEELSVKIQSVEKELMECKHATNIAFDKLAEKYVVNNIDQNVTSKSGNHNLIYPWVDLHNIKNIPAAPTTTTTVLNADNSGEVQVITKQLKPQEMDVIVKEIGQVPRHDINRFMKWFCDWQRGIETYNLNVDDMDRLLQRVVGNGLWIRVAQNCGQQRKTEDILKEMLKALYGVASNISLSGKVKQMKQECPYELSNRIATVMEYVLSGDPGFEHGGLVHRVMLLEALDDEIRDGIMSVTPDPSDLNDILLRADNLWQRKNRDGSFAVDAARVFRVEGQNRKENVNYQRPQMGNVSFNSNRQRDRGQYERDKSPRSTWIPFHVVKHERDKLEEELNTVKLERDKLQEELSRVKRELDKLESVRCSPLTPTLY